MLFAFLLPLMLVDKDYHNFFGRNSTYPAKYCIDRPIEGTFCVIKVALEYTGFDDEDTKVSHLVSLGNWVPGRSGYLLTTYVIARANP